MSTTRRDLQRRRGGGEDLCCVKEDRPHPREPSASCLQQERELQKSRWEGPLGPLTSLWSENIRDSVKVKEGLEPRTPASCPQVPLNVILWQR